MKNSRIIETSYWNDSLNYLLPGSVTVFPSILTRLDCGMVSRSQHPAFTPITILKSPLPYFLIMSKLRQEIDPFFMYGTAWKEDRTEELTLLALQSGFRAIDTANQRKHYFEAGAGQGIATFLETTDLARKDLFIQTKFTYQAGQDHRLPYDPRADLSEQVRQSMQSSLEHLQTDFVDSYILHGPSTRVGLHDRDYRVWDTMSSLRNEGLTRYIGASNISAQQLKQLLETDQPPQFVQNRCFAQNGWDQIVRGICEQNDIIYQGFSLLTANRHYLTDQRIRKIADGYELTIPGIIFAFARQIGMLPLTGTTQERHMRQDLSASDQQLTDEEIADIEQIAL